MKCVIYDPSDGKFFGGHARGWVGNENHAATYSSQSAAAKVIRTNWDAPPSVHGLWIVSMPEQYARAR